MFDYGFRCLLTLVIFQKDYVCEKMDNDDDDDDDDDDGDDDYDSQ